MKRSEPPNPFELEQLEERILLSGDPLSGSVQAIAPAALDSFAMDPAVPPIEETSVSGDNVSPHAPARSALQYNPSENTADIFSG